MAGTRICILLAILAITAVSPRAVDNWSIAATCPLKQTPFYRPHPLNCNSYLFCTGTSSVPFLSRCPKGQSFDRVSGSCARGVNVDCSTDPDMKNFPSNNSLASRTITDETRKIRCPISDYLAHVPHPSNCSRFYECARGVATEMECPPGLHFNPYLELCTRPSPGICSVDLPTEKFSNCDKVGPPICPATNVGYAIRLPHEKDCGSFYKCESGIPFIFHCPPGLHFNSLLQVCDWPSRSGCNACLESHITGAGIEHEIKDEISDLRGKDHVICPREYGFSVNIQHPENCISFYSCLSGRPILRRCPKGLFYNPATQGCDWRDSVDCVDDANPGNGEKSNSSESSGITVEEAPCYQHENCKYGSTLPNPTDRSTFYRCVWGRPILMNCPIGLQFNSKQLVCDWPWSVNREEENESSSSESSDSSSDSGESSDDSSDSSSDSSEGSGDSSDSNESSGDSSDSNESSGDSSDSKESSGDSSDSKESSGDSNESTGDSNESTGDSNESTGDSSDSNESSGDSSDSNESSGDSSDSNESSGDSSDSNESSGDSSDSNESSGDSSDSNESTGDSSDSNESSDKDNDSSDKDSDSSDSNESSDKDNNSSDKDSDSNDKDSDSNDKDSDSSDNRNDPSSSSAEDSSADRDNNSGLEESNSELNHIVCPSIKSNQVIKLVNPNDCSSFFRCIWGEPTLTKCPTGLHFNPESKSCDRPSKANCSLREKHPTPNGLECPLLSYGKAVFLPDRGDCSLYYACDTGKPKPMRCPDGLQFNPTLNVCDRSVVPGCQPSNTLIVAEDNFKSGKGKSDPNAGKRHECEMPICPPYNWGYVVQFYNPFNCNEFFKCNWGVAVKLSCPKGLHYNRRLQVCDYPHSAKCHPCSSSSNLMDIFPRSGIDHKDNRLHLQRNISPQISKKNNIVCPTRNSGVTLSFPDPEECASYYTCIFGELMHKSCPKGLHFNPILNVCDYPANALCGIYQESSTRSCPVVDSRLCSLARKGKLVNPSDCSSYYECEGHSITLKKCPNGLEFNAAMETCDQPKNARCRPCIEGRVKSKECTSYAHGHAIFLPEPNDCSVFYRCDWGLKVPYKCPDNLHFNRVLQECDLPERASCGSHL